MKKVIMATFVAIYGLMPLSAALAGGGLTGGATLPEQIVQEGTAVQQLAKQAQQLETQIEQYKNMVQNMTTIPQQLMSQINASLDQLTNLTSEAQALSTQGQNLSNQFAQMHAGESQTDADNYANQYQQISSNLSQADNNALAAANMNPSNFATVAQAQQAIKQALANPQSRNALLQGSVAAGQALVAETAQLVQTTNAEVTMQAAVNKARLARRNANNQANANAIANQFSGGPIVTHTPPLTSFRLSGY
jgi:P-type conjugative transfer protein TrbJ